MKKRLLKLALGLVGVIVIIVVAGLSYVKLALPNVGPAPKLAIKPTTAQIEHGRYLANHVAACIDCHSTRDFTKLAGPMVPGTEGKGGEAFVREMGFPGNFYAANITPASLGSWTDGEIFRAITTGVNRDGRALFPVMPYQSYARMDPEDIYDIIAYLRSLKPIPNKIPAAEPDFPMNFIINTIPTKAALGKRPNPADTVAYGNYLTTFASCTDCHTPADDKGQPLPGMEMAGGRVFPIPTGTVRSANLTPHATGILNMTCDAFIARFKAHTHERYVSPTVAQNEFNTIMPWAMYGGMSEQDLGAIYAYLRTLKPVNNAVTHFTPKSKLVASR
ncbi:c-type cytochrome [Spirosoma montaniterrae]|uniref:Cytochrome C n=1 Tax=Spirosoma montaniterrae TaxID=1178516 RepID=A0A1P9WXU0_9BACT|nr:c-type cytochrome [Spirosoma montaniterrae]AQG80173.1 cytochrome C [Spirosoma montaniterrae]